MTLSLPRYGADIEAMGVLGKFVGADRMGDGDVYFTVRFTSSNAKLLTEKLSAAKIAHVSVGNEVVQLSYSQCRWRVDHGEMFDADNQTMIGFSDRSVSVARCAQAFQAMLSRRNRA